MRSIAKAYNELVLNQVANRPWRLDPINLADRSDQRREPFLALVLPHGATMLASCGHENAARYMAVAAQIEPT